HTTDLRHRSGDGVRRHAPAGGDRSARWLELGRLPDVSAARPVAALGDRIFDLADAPNVLSAESAHRVRGHVDIHDAWHHGGAVPYAGEVPGQKSPPRVFPCSAHAAGTGARTVAVRLLCGYKCRSGAHAPRHGYRPRSGDRAF